MTQHEYVQSFIILKFIVVYVQGIIMLEELLNSVLRAVHIYVNLFEKSSILYNFIRGYFKKSVSRQVLDG